MVAFDFDDRCPPFLFAERFGDWLGATDQAAGPELVSRVEDVEFVTVFGWVCWFGDAPQEDAAVAAFRNPVVAAKFEVGERDGRQQQAGVALTGFDQAVLGDVPVDVVVRCPAGEGLAVEELNPAVSNSSSDSSSFGSPLSGSDSGPVFAFGLAAGFDSFGESSFVSTVVVAGDPAGPGSGVSDPQPLRPTIPEVRKLSSRNVAARFITTVSLSVLKRWVRK